MKKTLIFLIFLFLSSFVFAVSSEITTNFYINSEDVVEGSVSSGTFFGVYGWYLVVSVVVLIILILLIVLMKKKSVVSKRKAKRKTRKKK